jgi:hypothetical protein
MSEQDRFIDKPTDADVYKPIEKPVEIDLGNLEEANLDDWLAEGESTNQEPKKQQPATDN